MAMTQEISAQTPCQPRAAETSQARGDDRNLLVFVESSEVVEKSPGELGRRAGFVLEQNQQVGRLTSNLGPRHQVAAAMALPRLVRVEFLVEKLQAAGR